MALQNHWQYGVRIDNVGRDLFPIFKERFLDLDWFDPREKLAQVDSPERRERLKKRWPNLDALRVIVPITESFEYETLAAVITSHELRVEDMDVIIGLQLEDDTEYSAIPERVLTVIRKLGCKVVVNVTVMN